MSRRFLAPLGLLVAASCGGSKRAPESPANDGPSAAPAPVRLTIAELHGAVAEDFSDWIDAARGVLVVDFSSGGGADEAVESKHADRLCGDKLDVDGLRAGLSQRLLVPYEMTCAPSGERTICRSNGLGEYDVDVDWIFAPGENGPYLEALIAVERATMAQSWLDEADAFVTKALATHRAGSCP